MHTRAYEGQCTTASTPPGGNPKVTLFALAPSRSAPASSAATAIIQLFAADLEVSIPAAIHAIIAW
jgi:DHA1 family inner membrane transport protein